MAAFLLLGCALKQRQKPHALPTRWVQQGYTARLLNVFIREIGAYFQTQILIHGTLALVITFQETVRTINGKLEEGPLW